ncbi:MAG: molybdenum cofactor biosynthesis protein MoaE [Pseudomonadota bacterium]
MITLTPAPFDPAETLSAFTARAEGAGAIVSFTGLVRPESKSGRVSNLHLQAYSPMTETGIQTAHDRAMGRWSLTSAEIVHRIGDMVPRDPIVFVATAADHRRAAFEAADFLMDYLKTEAVFWKKETRASGETVWIEARKEDYTDSARWAETKG